MERWEEVDVVADATDAVAENFGWPCFEGDERHDGCDGVPGCQALPAAAVTPPVFRYEHYREVVPGDDCPSARRSSISGIAFPPGYRAEHAGSLFFADYTAGCIFELRAGEDRSAGPRDGRAVRPRRQRFQSAGRAPGRALEVTSTTPPTIPSTLPLDRCTHTGGAAQVTSGEPAHPGVSRVPPRARRRC